MPMPWGLDQHDLMLLFCAERYHWTEEQVLAQPLQTYIYLPVMWTAVAHLEAEAHRKNSNGQLR
jgi:hypothetical protein